MPFFDSNSGFGQTATGDVFEDQDALAKRKKLVDALQAKALSPQVQGNNKQALIQVLANLGTAYFAGQMGKDNAEQGKALNTQRQTELGQGIDKYMTTAQGAPGQTLNVDQVGALLNNDQDPGKLAEPVAANPRKAVVEAMASRHPELQAIGQTGLSQLGKAPPKDYTEHVTQDGSIVRTFNDGRTPQNLGNFAKPKDKFSDPYEMNDETGRKLLVKKNLATNEVEVVDKTPKITNTINGAEGTTAVKELEKKTPEVMQAARAQFIAGQEAVTNGQRIEKLLQSPDIITGFGAGLQQGLASVGAKLGIVGPEAAAQTQALIGQFAQSTLGAVKKLPGAISEKERPFLEEASAGKIDWTPEALRHLAGLAQEAGHNSLLDAAQQYNSTAQTFPEVGRIGQSLYPLPPMSHSLDPKQFDYSSEGQQGERVRFKGAYGVAPPGTSAPAVNQRPVSLSDYLKSKGVK